MAIPAVYYIFRYPSGHKVLLLAAVGTPVRPVAEMAATLAPPRKPRPLIIQTSPRTRNGEFGPTQGSR